MERKANLDNHPKPVLDSLAKSRGYEFISVLIIDDRSENAYDLKIDNFTDDYRLETVHSLPVALRFLETRINIGLILVPINNNLTKAFQIIQEIRNLRSCKYKPISLIFPTQPDDDLINKCLELGGIEWVVFDQDPDFKVLKNKIRTYVGLAKERLEEVQHRLLDSAERQRSLLNENRFLAAFDHASVAFSVADMAGHFLEINTAFEKLTGYSIHDIHMKNFATITLPDDLQMELNLIQKMRNREIPGYTIEKRFIHKTGKILWVRTSIFLVRDQVGRPVNVLATLDDITERKEADEALAQAQKSLINERQNFWNLLSQTPEVVCILSGPELEFEFANEAYRKLLGFDPVGKKFSEAQPESMEILNVLKKVFETGKTAQHRELSVTLQQELRYFNLTCSVRRKSDGTVSGVILLASEVTGQVHSREELKSAKLAAEAASAAKTAFLANMSHEIRTPLGAIMGFVDLMKQQNLNHQDFVQYLSIMERNSSQLSRLIDDILDLSKIEAGKMIIENINFSLTDFMLDFSSMMSFRANENGIDFQFKKLTELPEYINSDPLRLRQILINAVGNAIKFTQKGSVRLEASYENSCLSFLVIDTGRGISEAQSSNLFKVFSQADPSTTRKFGGTGLGLALSRSLCQMLGGDFTLVKSEIGKGSTFLARVHVSVPEKSFKGTTSNNSLNSDGCNQISSEQVKYSNSLKGMKILLVEDAPDNQVLITLILRMSGAEIDIAENGLEGVKKAQSQKYDVILMDIQMPVMDGHEATRTLRKSGYKGPIIALTAHAMKEEREQTKISGFSNFLTKPVHRAGLIAALKEIQHGLK